MSNKPECWCSFQIHFEYSALAETGNNVESTFEKKVSTPSVDWDGTWILKSKSSPTSCYPKEQAVISKLCSSLTFSWIWDSTESCKKVGLDGKPFAKTIQIPTDNYATLHYFVRD